jgi:hypothetical protein
MEEERLDIARRLQTKEGTAGPGFFATIGELPELAVIAHGTARENDH